MSANLEATEESNIITLSFPSLFFIQRDRRLSFDLSEGGYIGN